MKTLRKPRNLCKVGRTRVTVWLENMLVEKMRLDARERSVTQQSIIESAMRDYYRPPKDDLEGLIARRFNYLESVLKKLDSQSHVAAEAIALVIRLWLTERPEIVSGTKMSSKAQGFYRRCLWSVGKRIESGQTVFRDVEVAKDEEKGN